MKMKKNLMMMLAACLALSVPLSGCGSTAKDTSSSVSSEVSGEAETSGKSSQELLDEENAIMAKNNDLWEKVFASMSKNVTEDTLSSNYGDVLMAAVDGAKDQFTDAEYETLKSDAEQIRKIEEEIAALPTDSSEEQTSDASGTAFPQFEGKDLDGNKVDKKFMKEVVRMLGLEDKLNNMPSNLSGGQQQRVAIARALVSKPAIVLADEPTGNLDSMTSSDVLSLLKVTSTKFHQTLVMITHNNEIAQLADRIIRIEDGKIVQ